MFLAGQQTPVFFGSALTNYGMELFLKGFIERCPPPVLARYFRTNGNTEERVFRFHIQDSG